jgi:hypothetical protein
MGTSMSICLFGKFEISTQHTERTSSDADIEGGRGGRFAPSPLLPSPPPLLIPLRVSLYLHVVCWCCMYYSRGKNMLSVGFLLRENQA